MILVYGGWELTCLTPCSGSWKLNLRSSINQHKQQQEPKRQGLTICKSSGPSGNVVVIRGHYDASSSPRTRTRTSTTTTTSDFSLITTIVVASAVVVSSVIVMLSVMSQEADATDLVVVSSKVQQRRQQLSQMEMDETLLDIPQTLSSQDGGLCSSDSAKEGDCKKKPRIQRPKSRKAESCTIKCVTTCIRGGGGSPGEGPLNVRRPLVVFKEGFRSRQYCLIECSDICNLINEGDSGP